MSAWISFVCLNWSLFCCKGCSFSVLFFIIFLSETLHVRLAYFVLFCVSVYVFYFYFYTLIPLHHSFISPSIAPTLSPSILLLLFFFFSFYSFLFFFILFLLFLFVYMSFVLFRKRSEWVCECLFASLSLAANALPHTTFTTHNTHIIHTLHVSHTIHTQYTLYIYHTHNTHNTHFTCITHNTHTIHTQYTQNTHNTHIIHNTHNIHTNTEHSRLLWWVSVSVSVSDPCMHANTSSLVGFFLLIYSLCIHSYLSYIYSLFYFISFVYYLFFFLRWCKERGTAEAASVSEPDPHWCKFYLY